MVEGYYQKIRIRELDIKQTNISMLLYYKLIDEDTYIGLAKMDKNKRNITVGLMRRDNPKLSEAIKKGTEMSHIWLRETNNILTEDIMDINHDAIWIIGNKPIKQLKYPNSKIEYVVKGDFSSILVINKYKFFYNSITGEIVEKYVPKEILTEEFIYLISTIMGLMESGDIKGTYTYIHNYISNRPYNSLIHEILDILEI